MSSVGSICCSPPPPPKRRHLQDDTMTDAKVFGDFGIKMLQTGLKQQYDGFIRLNEVHQQQMQKLADENVRLHRHNVELASENAYLRRKVDEAKVLKTLMSMGGAAAEEEEDASPPSVGEEAEGNTATPNARPTFASVVAPGASALTDGLVADARRWSWMFLYEADQPIGATELNRLHPIFIRRVDSVRVDRGFYVALAQLSYRASCTRMVRELLKLVEAGVVKEVCGFLFFL